MTLTEQTSSDNTDDSRIPITILSGFLGSGKTTLLNTLMKPSFWNEKPQSQPITAVIMNEFGSVGLDHQLVDEMQGPMALLNGGCICCEIQGALVPTLKNLWMGRSDGTLPKYEHIIIETTGVADPTSIMDTLLWPNWVEKRHYLDGVVTTVDAVFAGKQLDEYHFEAVRQVARADRLLLTKTDLADDASVSRLKERLAKLNPAAPIIPVLHGHTDPVHIYNLKAYHQSKPAEAKQWLAADKFRLISPASSNQHASGIRVPKATASPGVDGRIRSFAVMFEQPLPWEGVKEALETLSSACSDRLLRMKAIVNLQERPDHPVVLHGVQHLFFPSVKLPEWPDDDHRSRFVFITSDLDESFVSNLLHTFTQTVNSSS